MALCRCNAILTSMTICLEMLLNWFELILIYYTRHLLKLPPLVLCIIQFDGGQIEPKTKKGLEALCPQTLVLIGSGGQI